jgi:hypothetical protein
MKQAIGAAVSRAYGALKPGAVVIAAAICDGWFNDEWFPAYHEVYDRLQRCTSTDEMAMYEDDLSTKAEYIRLYRYAYAYHPFHAFSMTYFGGIADRFASAIYVVGAKEPGYARGMGCIPTRTFDQALKHARRFVGDNPRILVVPKMSAPGLHVRCKG